MDYASAVAESLVGIVRVDISCVAYEYRTRKYDRDIIDYLLDVFKDSRDGCEQNTTDHRIPGLVSHTELDHILENSQLTRDSIRRLNLERQYPKVNVSNTKIRCVRGLHVLTAADEFLQRHDPENRWWLIELFSFNSRNHHHEEAFARRESERHFHETPHGDGDVFLNVRYYQRQFQHDSARDWKIRRTGSKQECLAALLAHRDAVTGGLDFMKAFEKFEPFHGVWKGFQLGTMKQDFALHSDEELLHCLHHTHEKLSEITLGNPVVQEAFDNHTCRQLQGRAPTASLLDRQYIAREMDRGALFVNLEDRMLRQAVKQALLRFHGIIFTLRSYHQNLRYFSIAVRIVRSLVLTAPIKATMYQALRDCWTPTEPLVEVGEDDYRRAVLSRGLTPVRFAYIGLLVAAFRCFPTLGPDSPCKERELKRKQAQMDANVGSPTRAAKIAFLRHAFKLGFRTDKIIRGLRATGEDLTAGTLEPFTEDSDGESINRRTGKPYANAYMQLRTQLFLPNLLEARAGAGLDPSVMFVQREFFNAFFGCIDNEWDIALPAPQAVLVGSAGTPVLCRDTGDSRTCRPRLGMAVRGREGGLEDPDAERSEMSPRPVSSMYSESQPTQQSRASPELSQATESRWSQFSLPTPKYSDSDDDDMRDEEETRIESLVDSHRSFDALPFEERRSFPVSMQGADSSTTTLIRSFPDLDESQSRRSAIDDPWSESSGEELLESSMADGTERRSFPSIAQSITSKRPASSRHERHPFLASRLLDSDPYRYSAALTPDSTFTFTECNGMTERRILTSKMREHLVRRQGWVMMVLKHNVLKTIRFEDIIQHMRRPEEEAGERQYYLVRRDHAERFRTKQMNRRARGEQDAERSWRAFT